VAVCPGERAFNTPLSEAHAGGGDERALVRGSYQCSHCRMGGSDAPLRARPGRGSNLDGRRVVRRAVWAGHAGVIRGGIRSTHRVHAHTSRVRVCACTEAHSPYNAWAHYTHTSAHAWAHSPYLVCTRTPDQERAATRDGGNGIPIATALGMAPGRRRRVGATNLLRTSR
jgi:hypothetical protein